MGAVNDNITEDKEEHELEAEPTHKTPAAVVPQHRPSPEFTL